MMEIVDGDGDIQDSTSMNNKDDDNGLSTVEILYITIFVMFGVAVLLASCLYYIYRKDRRGGLKRKEFGGWAGSKASRADIEKSRRKSMAADMYMAGSNPKLPTQTKLWPQIGEDSDGQVSKTYELYIVNEALEMGDNLENNSGLY